MEKFYKKDLLHNEPGQELNFEKFFEYVREFQKDADSVAELADTKVSKVAAPQVGTKSQVSPTGGEPDSKRAKKNKRKDRKPKELDDAVWKKWLSLKSTHKLTFRKKMCYAKILSGKCERDVCKFDHTCPSCNKQQGKDDGHIVFECTKLKKT